MWWIYFLRFWSVWMGEKVGKQQDYQFWIFDVLSSSNQKNKPAAQLSSYNWGDSFIFWNVKSAQKMMLYSKPYFLLGFSFLIFILGFSAGETLSFIFCFQSLVLYLVYQLWWTLIVELLWNKNGLPYVYVWLLRNWRKRKERRMKLKHNISFLSFLFILVSVR